jgi:hypothetical protein
MNEEIGLFVKLNGFRGVFPCAADSDLFKNNNTLVYYIVGFYQFQLNILHGVSFIFPVKTNTISPF